MPETQIIGGEFNFSHNLLIDRKLNRGGYSSGRSALFYILLDVRERFHLSDIMLPDYLCTAILPAIEKAGFRYEFYSLTDKLELDEDSFSASYDETKAVLIINYFGIQAVDAEEKYIRHLNDNAVIIEDDSQAYYDYIQDSTFANYKFTSLRKTFASPDGGLVKTEYSIAKPDEINTFYQYKVASGLLRGYRGRGFYDDDVYLNLSCAGESIINSEIDTGISDVAYSVMVNTDLNQIKNVRTQNASHLVAGLNHLNIQPVIQYIEGMIPLFIPIWLEHRDKVRQAMFSHNVFCPVHWPIEGLNVKKGSEMAEHELSLIVDQRYTTKDMDFILEVLEKSVK